jgi:regulator of RNase E activity RraA
VDASGPGKIIVIAHNGRTDVAGWGGILSRGACRNKVEGIVIDGACRDLDESRQFGLTIYGRCAVPVTARGRIIETNWNVPVKMSGIDVAPGDLVLADASGVVFVSALRATEILEIAERIAAKERLMMTKVDEGHLLGDVMGTDYESMLSEGDQQ